MTRITDMRSDLEPERFGWLIKSPLAGYGIVEFNVPLDTV